MPITTFQTILSTDKLQSGFRAKINADIALLITDIVDNGNATATAELQGGTVFQIDLSTSFYTKAQVQALITAVTPAIWGAITGNVENQTDVVGNLGVISGIDAILLSINFAVASGDPDNPFGAFPASGYASFSVPGNTGTGWQLLIKEGANAAIKFRLYYSGTWFPWMDIGIGGAVISKTLTTSNPDTYTLSPAELVTLNLYARYPNFVAIVTSTGQQFSDIFPIYTGTVGNFTACVVQLHSDGSGSNADNTTIQFS
jgi:hypothetical protein